MKRLFRAAWLPAAMATLKAGPHFVDQTRRVTSGLSTEERLSAIEKEMSMMKGFIKEVQTRNPSLAAEISANMASSPSASTNIMSSDSHILDAHLLEELYEFYGLQPIELRPLKAFMQVQTAEDLLKLASHVHREYLVRLAHRARTLRQAPLGLAQMPSIRELRRWYEISFADMRYVKLATLEDLIAFDATVRKILVRHRSTADFLSNGLYEFASREELLSERKLVDNSQMKVYREVQQFFDTFCDTRVRIRFMLGHHAGLSARLLADQLPNDIGKTDDTAQFHYGHNPNDFVGFYCSKTDARKVVLAAINASRDSEVEDSTLIPPVNLIVHQQGVPAYQYTGSDDASHGSPFTYHSVPFILYGSSMALIGEAIRSNVIRKLRFGIGCEPITVEITQGKDLSDVAVTVTDTAGGMTLPILKSSLTCVASCRAYLEEQQLCKRGSASFDRVGCGWSHCPIRLPYAAVACRVFGGDVNISSLEGVGTSRNVFVPTDRHKLEATLI